MNRRPVRSAVGVVVAATLTASLVTLTPTAEAATTVVATLSADGDADSFSADCTTTDSASPDVEEVPVPENGGAVSAQRGSNATTTYTPEPADVTVSSSAVSATASVTSVGDRLSTIDVAARGSASLVRGELESSCETFNNSTLELDHDVVVVQGGFLTVTVRSRGDLMTQVDLFPAGDKREAVFTTWGGELKVDSISTIFLPPGEYRGQVRSTIEAFGTRSVTRSGTVSVHMGFAVAGSQSAATSGKGAPYVTLPSSRSCASHSVEPRVTGKGKRAAKIRQVKVFVGNALVRKMSRPDKGAVVAIPVPDEADADIRAVVQLIRSRRGRPGRVVEVTAGYVACS